jgi:hypothetical protein
MAANANSNPPKKNQEFTFPIVLFDYNTGNILTNPTLAAGDFKIYVESAGAVNLTDLPTIDPAGEDRVQVYVTAAQMNGNNILVTWKDQTSPKAWRDGSYGFVTTA